MTTLPQGYDEAAFTRALLALQGAPPPPAPLPQVAQTPQMPLNMQAQQIPNPAQALLAALPWLQYLQMQNQYGQLPQQMHQGLYMPQPLSSLGSGQVPQYSSNELDVGRTSSASPTETALRSEMDNTDVEPIVIAEDKRRRNTAASARFRIKKKQWTLNLERTISDLSSRVQELEAEAAELRRENGWLKEIVMLKSKRATGVVSDSGEIGPFAPRQTSITDRDREVGNDSSSAEGGFTAEEKGKERQS
ncbi:uncharacterized protein FIBRA_02377 [Fibroporia radiculosa]|uniref:BZIP domain-containing protein n=1 Tax=Fibroporia radiculosa TaxID=599839 RepID=J4HUU1_9APHY|nr:uncharacterized protein FIBRA_02377 [Fibroporia radiculosa]CCM00347.1 predicted protein [Fibroporia radiculosa]